MTIKVSPEFSEQCTPMRNSANRHRKAMDRYAVTHFDACGQHVGPITNVDCSSGKNVDLIIILQQHCIMPRERLRSPDHCFLATLNNDCDLVHISPPCLKPPVKSSAIRALLKRSSYLLRPINPSLALTDSF